MGESAEPPCYAPLVASTERHSDEFSSSDWVGWIPGDVYDDAYMFIVTAAATSCCVTERDRCRPDAHDIRLIWAAIRAGRTATDLAPEWPSACGPGLARSIVVSAGGRWVPAACGPGPTRAPARRIAAGGARSARQERSLRSLRMRSATPTPDSPPTREGRGACGEDERRTGMVGVQGRRRMVRPRWAPGV